MDTGSSSMPTKKTELTETIIIVDVETGESIQRVFTAEEQANRKTTQTEYEITQAEAREKSEARTSALAKLAALGLTAEEIAAL
jgi:hypothetical protein